MIAAVCCGLLAVALAVVVWAWIESCGTATAQAVMIRHLRARVDGYRAELDALSIAPPAAVAALTPDDPSLLPAEVEQWLRTHTREF